MAKAKHPKYRSAFERRVAARLPASFRYEAVKIKFSETRDRTYTPDFGDKPRKLLVEAKGRFRTSEEARKAVAGARAARELGWRVLFVLYNTTTKAYPQCKRRADGTTLSIAEYLTRAGLRWCAFPDLAACLRAEAVGEIAVSDKVLTVLGKGS